jgi:hypothetical protein
MDYEISGLRKAVAGGSKTGRDFLSTKLLLVVQYGKQLNH